LYVYLVRRLISTLPVMVIVGMFVFSLLYLAPGDPAAPSVADRTGSALDDLLPGANAWAARVLLGLAEATGDPQYRRRAEAALGAFASVAPAQGLRAATYLGAAQQLLAAR